MIYADGKNVGGRHAASPKPSGFVAPSIRPSIRLNLDNPPPPLLLFSPGLLPAGSSRLPARPFLVHRLLLLLLLRLSAQLSPGKERHSYRPRPNNEQPVNRTPDAWTGKRGRREEQRGTEQEREGGGREGAQRFSPERKVHIAREFTARESFSSREKGGNKWNSASAFCDAC